MLDYKPMKKRKDETCSYPDTQIIGRDEDLEIIVGTLLDCDVQRDVSVLTIVGMGGLGKTALAQLVYNNKKVRKKFHLRLWTCVSDHDQAKLDVKIVLCQILEAATGQKHDAYSFEVVVNQLRKVLAGKRYLIVLDDLWTESRDEWRKLAAYLLVGQQGSQVVVTTRSKETAKIVGSGLMYELNGLSDENSWRLFQLMAFEQVLDPANLNGYVDFINMGKDIVKKCANVPLAIRVIGGLLYGQDKSKWISVHELGLANLREDQNGIKPILKLSYHNLESPLKSCFSYCSLYPKDFEIKKEKLINLWIAQGYVVPLAIGQTIDDASEEYFITLLRRCFFQDVSKDKFGEIFSFKLHDLMHDVALEVSHKEICSTSSFSSEVGKVVRHVSLKREQYGSDSFTNAHIRTYMLVDIFNNYEFTQNSICSTLANYRFLRTLDLSWLYIKILPVSIGKLIHLRYLDLSGNFDLEVLPQSITKLSNLQTFHLGDCEGLKDLPKDLSKLFNLRVLGLKGCKSLMFMPLGMSKLSDLHSLPMYVVGKGSSGLKLNAELEGLKALKKLRGDIEIKTHFHKSGGFVREDTLRERAYMRDKEYLNTISISCIHDASVKGATDYEEELLGAMQPHSNLKELRLRWYQGIRMPRWAKKDNLATFLPNLIQLDLSSCSKLQCLPSLGKLQQLKTLDLSNMPNLEYIESHPTTASLPTSSSEGLRFLAPLRELTLSSLPKLKGWWGSSGDNSTLFLSQLIVLHIFHCPNLTSLPDCPNVENLAFSKINEGLRILSNPRSYPKLSKFEIDNLAWLHSSLPIESYQSLSNLCLYNVDVESLTGIGVVLRACSSSLLSLRLLYCPKLRSLSGGLGHLVALEKLSLRDLPKLNLANEEIDGDVEGDAMPWGSLCNTLLSLRIFNCKELQTFPKWMRKLISLEELRVTDCSTGLYERCQNPDGEDWPNIQHIPQINILPEYNS